MEGARLELPDPHDDPGCGAKLEIGRHQLGRVGVKPLCRGLQSHLVPRARSSAPVISSRPGLVIA
jgi:hypothetical protein